MQTLRIEVNSSIHDHVMFFLENLPKNLIRISHETPKEAHEKNPIRDQVADLMARNHHLHPFDAIDDPVAWQHKVRDEWE